MNNAVAVIGTGYWGQNLVRNYHALGALSTVCDLNTAALDSVKYAYPGVRVTTAYEDILEDPEIKGVVIATPADAHYTYALRALQVGKDVYVEKPITLQLDHAEELVALAESSKRILMVGHLLHYHPAFTKLKQMVADGLLGSLQYIYSNRLSLGKVRRDGNSLWSFAPHDISMLLALTGKMPTKVKSFGTSVLQKEIADVTNTMMEFEGGVGGHIFVSWLHPFKEHKLVVVASHKMAVFEDTQPWDKKLAIYPHSVTWEDGIPIAKSNQVEYIAIPPAEPLKEECQHFLDCIRERTSPVTDGAEGLRVLRVLDAAQVSMRDRNEPPPTVVTEKPGYFAHSSCFIDQPCTIGEGTKIWHFSHVLKGATLGKNCNLGQNVSIASDVVIGDNVKIQNNVSVYTGTVIEDNVFLGPSAVFTNVTNPRSEIVRRGLYEQTVICKGASVGANATIVCGIKLGRYCFVAAGAVVAKDVPDYALMVGVPARQMGWISRHGHRLEADPQGIMRCPESQLTYVLTAQNELRCREIGEDEPLPEKYTVGTLDYKTLKRSKNAVY